MRTLFKTYFEISNCVEKMSILDVSKPIIPSVSIRIEIGKKTKMETNINKIFTGTAYLSNNKLIIKEFNNLFEYEFPRSIKIEIFDTMRRGFSNFYVGSYLTVKIPLSEDYIYCSSIPGEEILWLRLLSEITDLELENYKINQVEEKYFILFQIIIALTFIGILRLIVSLPIVFDIIITALFLYVVSLGLKSKIEGPIIEKIVIQNEKNNIKSVDLEDEDSPLYKPFI